jgi:lipopolysaccharide/colanic/teichoic acid biosynthesis glycosyltransferase
MSVVDGPDGVCPRHGKTGSSGLSRARRLSDGDVPDLVVVSDRLELLGRDHLFAIVDAALKGAVLCRVSRLAPALAHARSEAPDPEIAYELLDQLQRHVRSDILKRALDYALATLLLVFAIPLLLLLALLIRLDSPGPVFFVQERLGQHRRPFGCIKFRTMFVDAERLTGPALASKNDARITRIGRFLRRSRLDELPQLVNVLRGDMSLVGTRPIRAYFADQLAAHLPYYELRFCVKPGLTGWAQVRYEYSYASSFAQQIGKFYFDYYYVRNRSLALDLYILLLTPWIVVRLKGM